ncbi:hypothetical protein ACJJTC_019225 [Scirpophaga incertulas]
MLLVNTLIFIIFQECFLSGLPKLILVQELVNPANFHYTGNSGTMETTAEVVEFLDRLFDSVKRKCRWSCKRKTKKSCKPNSGHVEFWTESIKKIKSIMFEDSGSEVALQAGQARLVRVPTIEGWITTLESFVRLTNLLFQKYRVDYYYPRNVN